MERDLDLYAGPRISWKKALSITAATLLLVGIAGYKWMTTSTPVSREHALDVFHEEQSAARKSDDSGRSEAAKDSRPGHEPGGRSDAGRGHVRAGATGAAGTASSASVSHSQTHAATKSKPPPGSASTLPEEGVYSWHTEGYEEASGARRSFPEESQRIVTLDGHGGWNQHHYFSEEREIWTHFRVPDGDASIASQRNKVVFGPVTNDSTIDFSPPMLVGPSTMRVGQTWSGEWSGDTYGSYTGRTFEHTTLTIGDKQVETWAVEVDMHMEGEIQGDVLARVWVAPKYGLTVKEYYVQDVKASVGSYHGEWTMTLKSLRPQQ
jgi:hypothetical protein